MSASFPSLGQTPRAFPLPTIAEDTLHYTLHLAQSSPYPSALALLITEYVESLLIQPWLWNKDGWELKVVADKDAVKSSVKTDSSSTSGSKLEGRMRVGDAVDDEWLVVWLLREVSRKWPELVMSIRDTDGEFLLIEAANDLPSWVSPENSDNRLWLQAGHLHLIPLSVRSHGSAPRQIPDEEEEEKRYDPEAWISEEDAVRAVRTGKYRAEEKMEKAVWARIACYPGALKTHQHRTKAWLPVPIARALKHSPELIQRAVEGFYVRDPAQLRAAARMSHFPPSPAVLSPVLLTRAAYAQLQGQVFHPPRIFGPEWHVREGKELEDERKWRDLGVKIATGFEIMYREGGKKGRGREDRDAAPSDTPEYQRYISQLKAAGFFGNELEGSEKWKERELQAAAGWKSVHADDVTSQRPSFAFQVDTAIDSAASIPVDELQASDSTLEDSDSWLEVSPDELDGMMMRASGRTANDASEKAAQDQKVEIGDEHGLALQDLAKKVQEFVGGEGDVQGARFADELSDEDMDEDDSDDEVDEKAEQQAREEKMRNLVPALPAEEWGQKAPLTAGETGTKGKAKATPPPPSLTDTFLPAKMRPPVLAKQEYDGVVYESDDSEDEELPPPGTLGRKIAEMKWGDGEDKSAKIEEVDDDGQPEPKRKFGLGDDIDDAMMRKVWGEGDKSAQPVIVGDEGMEIDEDPDMQGEEEEFLKFSREALGISDEMWKGILDSREARGAYLPKSKSSAAGPGSQKTKSASKASTSGSADPAPAPASAQSAPGEPNMALNSFESVMAAMDEELARHKRSTAQPGPTPFSSGGPSSNPKRLPKLPTEADLDDLDDDELEAMDRELKAALKSAGYNSDDDDDDDDGLGVAEAKGLEGEDKREYRMMRDFLESYKSQGGGSGVVGNLFGRLGEGSNAQ